MNKTKKLTQGAMMIAIVGAMILVDRLLANWFDTIVTLIAPVVIIMYSAMYTVKDGIYVSIGILVVTFLFGNTDLIYLIYIPVGVFVGLCYSYAVNKNMDKRTCLIVSVVTYVIGEIIAGFIVYPILGYSLDSQLQSLKVSLDSMNYTALLQSAGLDISKVLVIGLIVSTVILGLMEGIVIHLLAVFLLKRFRIKDLGRISIWDMKPNKTVCYICFISMFSLFFGNYIQNESLYYVLMSLSMFGAMVLIYYGYLFIVLFGQIVLHKNISFFLVIGFVLLTIPVLFLTIVVGFLYGAGPLREYLERKVNIIQQ